jgi:hypothetical protein
MRCLNDEEQEHTWDLVKCRHWRYVGVLSLPVVLTLSISRTLALHLALLSLRVVQAAVSSMTGLVWILMAMMTMVWMQTQMLRMYCSSALGLR